MFGPAVDHLVGALHAAGINAADDPADLNTPGVWITPTSWERDRLDTTAATVTLTLYLVAGSSSTRQALASLDGLADRVTAAGFPVTDVEAVTVTLPNHNPGGLPGLSTTTTLHITED